MTVVEFGVIIFIREVTSEEEELPMYKRESGVLASEDKEKEGESK